MMECLVVDGQKHDGRFCCSCCSVDESCLTVCGPMDCSTPGSPVFHYLMKFAQILVHWFGRWYYLTISSSAAPSSFCLQYFPISWFFTSGWHNIGTSTSASVLLINIQGWVPLGLTGLTSLLSKRLLESSPTSQFKSINFWHSVFFMVQLSLLYLTTRKTVALTLGTFVSRMSAF